MSLTNTISQIQRTVATEFGEINNALTSAISATRGALEITGPHTSDNLNSKTSLSARNFLNALSGIDLNNSNFFPPNLPGSSQSGVHYDHAPTKGKNPTNGQQPANGINVDSNLANQLVELVIKSTIKSLANGDNNQAERDAEASRARAEVENNKKASELAEAEKATRARELRNFLDTKVATSSSPERTPDQEQRRTAFNPDRNKLT